MSPASYPRRLLAVALSIALAGPAVAAHTGAAVVPEDFNLLMEGQTEYLDVSLLGQRLGMFPVMVRPDTVTFEQPDAVIDALLASGARLDDPARQVVAQALSSSLPTHEALACTGAFGACGYVATDTADVILDRQRGSLALFLRPDWLAREAPDARLHLPSDDSENALIHRQSALYASGRGFSSFSASGTGAIGITEGGFLGFDWRLIRQQARDANRTDWNLGSAYLRQDIHRTHYVQLGRMDMRNLASPLGGNFGISMQPFPQIEGVRVGTTEAYVNREVAGRGTPISIILTQPGRVDAYRGDELLGSSYLQAGMQEVDTSSFPVGSYPVTLRVIQNGVVAREELTPFFREGGSTSQLTGTQWFAQAGHAIYNDEASLVNGRSRLAALQAGVRLPLSRGLAVGNSLAHVGGQSYDEARVDAWFPLGRTAINVSASHLVGSDGARGQVQQVSIGGRVSWNLYRYRTVTSDCSDQGRGPRRGFACATSISATVSTSVLRGQATLGYTRSSARQRFLRDRDLFAEVPLPGRLDTEQTASRSLSASYSRVLNMGHETFASVGVNGYRRDLASGHRDHGGFLSVSLTRVPSTRPHAATRVQTLGSQLSTRTAGAARATLRVGENRAWRDDGYREIGLQASGDDSRRFNATVNGRYETATGRFSALLSSDTVRGYGSTFSTSASYASMFALSRSGFFLGADRGGSDPSSGVAVSVTDVEGAAGRGAARLTSSSGTPITVGVGQKRLIPMDAFQKTMVETSDPRVAAKGAKAHVSVETGMGPRPWFLTPGKLGRHPITSRLSLTYVGRLTLPEGSPAGTPRLLNAVHADVDDQGGFVAEFDHRPEVFYAWSRGTAFVCRPQVVPTGSSVTRVGQLTCEGTPLAALPVHVREKLPHAALGVATTAMRKGVVP